MCMLTWEACLGGGKSGAPTVLLHQHPKRRAKHLHAARGGVPDRAGADGRARHPEVGEEVRVPGLGPQQEPLGSCFFGGGRWRGGQAHGGSVGRRGGRAWSGRWMDGRWFAASRGSVDFILVQFRL